MRKTLILSLTVFLAVVLTYGFANAITGQCSNCHTMHNSQNGAAVTEIFTGSAIDSSDNPPQNYLLIASCIACHTGNTGETNTHSAPIVVHITPPGGQGAGMTLAGGDFYWVADGLGNNDSRGHNVAGLAGVDGAIGYTPPGFDSSATSGFAFGTVGDTWNASNQLSCDGIYGCHGQHSSSGISGAHHGNTGGTSNQCSTANTVGNSYRFLGGIKGLENADWNWNETSDANHNEYFGVDSPDSRSLSSPTYPAEVKATISFSCAECHGYFHSAINSSATGASPWLRHPTDIALKGSGEYTGYTTYSVEAPVARPTVYSSSSGDVSPGTDIVMCLSCHRAHGSDQSDILRWNYADMIAGGGSNTSGCFTCHTQKDVAP